MFKHQTNKAITVNDAGLVFTKYFVGDKGGVMNALKNAATVDGVYNEDKMKDIIENLFEGEHPLFNVYHNDVLANNLCDIDVLNMVFVPDSDGKTSFSVFIKISYDKTPTGTIEISETDLWSDLFTSSGDVLLSIPALASLRYSSSAVVRLPWESAGQPATRFTSSGSSSRAITVLLPAGTIINPGSSQNSLTEPQWVLFK